jgi:hypothetical protein
MAVAAGRRKGVPKRPQPFPLSRVRDSGLLPE